MYLKKYMRNKLKKKQQVDHELSIKINKASADI